MHVKRKYIVCSIGVIALLAIIFIPNWTAIGMIMGVGFEQGSFQPLNFFTETPERTRHTLSINDRTVDVDVYATSESLEKKRGVIIYTPFIAGGLDDPQVQRIAETFARIGFIASVTSKKVDGPIISLNDKDDLLGTVSLLKEKYDAQDFGFIGLCFGNGPVFGAATDPSISDSVRFVISFAPYFDLHNAVSFLKTGTYEYGEIQGMKEPAPYGVSLADASLTYYGLSGVTLAEALHDKMFLSLREELSPSAHLPEINFDLYVLHSLDDSFIPYTESLRLYDSLKGKTHVQLLLSQIFTHEEFRPVNPVTLYKYYIPEAFRLYSFYSAFISNIES